MPALSKVRSFYHVIILVFSEREKRRIKLSGGDVYE
jgi:hypothetical protein